MRATVPEPLSEDVAWRIGNATAQFLRTSLTGYDRSEPEMSRVIVGRDMRTHSPALSRAFIEGVVVSGTPVVDIGMGSPTGIGFGTGFERIILNLKAQGLAPPGDAGPLVYVAHQSEGARREALRLASRLRRQGVAAIVAVGDRSLKSQMRQADGLGVGYTVILGEREVAAGTVLLKSMADGSQREVAPQEALEYLARQQAERIP